MAGDVINPSTKFEDPTAIRSWVMSSDNCKAFWLRIQAYYVGLIFDGI